MEKTKNFQKILLPLTVILIVLLAGILFPQLTSFVIKPFESFNLEVEIPKTYEEVLAGENMWFTTKLLNLGSEKRKDVTLKYEVFDADRKLKSSKSETVAVETQASFVGDIGIPKNSEEGPHFLKVTLISPFGEYEAETSFNVIKEETKNQVIIKFSLFDIQIAIPNDYKIIYPGDELLASIKLVNLGSAGRIDVFLEYWIIDSEQKAILRNKETVAVETQANFVRTFDIPKDVKPGKYSLHAKLIYADGKKAEAENSFEVVKKQIDKKIYYGLTGLLGLIILISIIYKSGHLVKKIQLWVKVRRIVKKREIK